MGLTNPVELNIEELVFEGYSPAEARLAGEALQVELARLFSERGLPPGFDADRSLELLDAGDLTLRPGERPAAAGRQVAAWIYGRLGS